MTNGNQLLHSRASALTTEVNPDIVSVKVSTENSYGVTIQSEYKPQDFLVMLHQIMTEASAQRVLVLSDENVGEIIANSIIDDMRNDGIQVDSFFMPAGEDSKSTHMLEMLWRHLKEKGVERRTIILGIGGGVVCDISGLVAATYLRGLPYMLIPTTLMAQVDAAIGGKVGADFMSTKNWIGGFYHPIAVAMHTEHLATLNDEEFSNGMAELIKVAAVVGGPLWDGLEGLSIASLREDPSALTQLIRAGFIAKLDLLAPDPFEVTSLDRSLNFGHCLGHAVEAASGFKLRHGFAVAIGMMMALRIGVMRNICDENILQDLEARLKAHDLPTTTPLSLLDASWQGVSDLRKVRNGALRMAIPASPGNMAFVNDVTLQEFRWAAGHAK